MDKKLNIYLCDLTYDTIILVSDTIPINIGFVGSYLNKQFGKIRYKEDNYLRDIYKQVGENFTKYTLSN